MTDTGYPHADAQNDFQRQRRRQVLAQLAARLRREPDDVSNVLPFDEVVTALGYLGERPLGLHAIPLDAIVGSVNLAVDFDRWFRPRSRVSRERWARAMALDHAADNIRVNSISPDPSTRPCSSGRSKLRTRSTPGRGVPALGPGSSIGRIGTPEEVAELAAFLVSDKAAFCTGGDYLVDGGLLAGIGVQ